MTESATTRTRTRRPTVGVRWLLLAVALAVIAGLVWLAVPRPEPVPDVLDRARVIDRAESWTDIGVPYNQLTYRDGYRMDCSGFVSMAWDLPENLTTWRIPQVAEPIEKRDLRPGDVLLDHTSDNRHVVIFEKWANARRTRYWGLECTGQEGVMGSVRRELPYPYRINAEHYRPYRYVGMDGYWKQTPEDHRQPVEGYDGSETELAATR